MWLGHERTPSDVARRGAGANAICTHFGWLVALGLLGAACGARSDLATSDPGADAGPDAATDMAPDAAPPELCDGLDNDGDGEVDEGAPPRRCGVGACARESPCGVECVPGPPAMEACGPADDDCDGAVDEGLALGPLADAIEIREGVGGYDACGSCRWTLRAVLAPTEEGYLAMWAHGISGGNEIPNVWSRRLGPDLVPLAPPTPTLPGATLIWMGAISRAMVRGETLLRVVERAGTSDLPRFVRVNASGALTLENDWLQTRPRPRNASANVIFTGERMVAVSWDRAGPGSLEDNRIRVTSANFDGSDLRELEVPAPYAVDGNVSSYGDRVAIRSYVVNADVEPVERRTELLVVDALAMPLQEPRDVDLPYTTWARWIARDDSIRFWNTSARTATERFALSWSGERTEGPLLFEDERRLGDSPSTEAMLEEEAGFALIFQLRDAPSGAAPEVRIEVRDDDGVLLREGSTEAPPHPSSPDGAFLGRPELRRRGGEYHAIWTDGALGDVANRIWVQRFGCAE
ncbi:MAG: hypothetical protein AAF447_19110 [Myxococcota bacterium]